MSGFRNQLVVRIYGSCIVYSSIVLVNYLCSYVVISVGLLNMICCIGQIILLTLQNYLSRYKDE